MSLALIFVLWDSHQKPETRPEDDAHQKPTGADPGEDDHEGRPTEGEGETIMAVTQANTGRRDDQGADDREIQEEKATNPGSDTAR